MSNREQIEFWNGAAGERWVHNQERLDRALEPFGIAALERLNPSAGEAILDVGCGAGATLLQLAERVSPAGRVVGLDPSRPLLARARERTGHLPNVSVLEGDAATQRYPAPFAGCFSRFGLMFFSDPAQAFKSLRRALVSEGRLVFACWQSLEDNAWCHLPLVAARSVLSEPPAAPDPSAPGPFAFASPARVAGILRGAGFHRIELEAFRCPVLMASEGLEAAVEFSMQVGPVTRLLAAQPDGIVQRARERIRETLGPLLRPAAGGAGRLELEGAAWLATARA